MTFASNVQPKKRILEPVASGWECCGRYLDRWYKRCPGCGSKRY